MNDVRVGQTVVIAFVLYVVLGVAGLVLLRAHLSTAAELVKAGQLLNPSVLLAAAGATSYAVSFALWLVVLANVPLSRAYPLAVGATSAGSALCAWALLGERMSARLIAGLVVIVIGGVLVSTA